MVFTIVAAIGSVLFAGAMLYYARSLLLPVQQMSRGARRVADGEYDIEDFNFARSDEIGMLADSFNHLKHQIARTIHALESEAQLEKSLRQQESEAARLRQLIEQDQVSSMIFWGSAGRGRRTLARIIAERTQSHFVDFSCGDPAESRKSKRS